jgi:hypothetical protein
MKHLKSPLVLTWLVALIALLPQTAFAQKNPRIGVWTLDVAKSTFEQGTAPASEKRTFLATNDGGIQLIGEAITATGTKQPMGYRAKYDGKDHPYSGMAGDTIAMTGDGWASDSTIKSGGKVTQTTHGVVSKDGRTMTLVTKTAAGNAVNTRVYHKQT